ncbi:MAG: T9SS type A sorting domain-containing protein, partial [Calditrichota bacterium]
GQVPSVFDVKQNYPNPFNPNTTIKYQLPKTSEAELLIFNILGQRVRTLVKGKVQAGYYEAVWDGRNDLERQVASGIYIYRFKAADFQKTLKIILLR